MAHAEMQFEDAMRNLVRCSLSLFQPVELFPLFPEVTAPWVDHIPSKKYWGLHQPLLPLQTLLTQESQRQTRTLLEQEAMQTISEYLLQVCELACMPHLPVFKQDYGRLCTKGSGSDMYLARAGPCKALLNSSFK